jgi:hypothetical protein
VHTGWRVVHLWFERDAVEGVVVPGNASTFWWRYATPSGPPAWAPPLQRVWARSAPVTLARRAHVAVNLASGDQRLRARLDHATGG